MSTAQIIVAAADGSALDNPGPAGWAWYIDEHQWAAGGWKRGTNNQGELQAVLELLKATASAQRPLRVLCDSQYVINALTKWRFGWKKRGWKKADGKPVLNATIIKELDAELAGREVTFEWVRGHTGHQLNEAADERARAAAEAFKAGQTHDAGPGFDRASGSKNSPDSGSHTTADSGTADTDSQRAESQGVGVAAEPLLSVPSEGEDTNLGQLREALALLEAEFLDAVEQRDLPALRYLADDAFRGVAADGRLHGVDDLLSAQPVEHLSMVATERVSEGVAYVAYRAERASEPTAVVLSWWRKDQDRWRCMLRQETAETAPAQ